MFATTGLFRNLACPERDTCTRQNCLFSHSSDVPPPKPLVKQATPVPTTIRSSTPSTSGISSKFSSTSDLHGSNPHVVPAKRPALASPTKMIPNIAEPPRKLQKVGVAKMPLVPVASSSESGMPVLRINAAQSSVAIPVRQTMLKTLYEHFVILYKSILSTNPSLASEHALRQEDEVYKKSTKLTYRNASALKRREVPTSISHPSVGTEGDIVSRAEARKSLENLQLTADRLEPFIHTTEELKSWGYFVDIPPGPGGDRPSQEGKIAKCERCTQYFLVKRAEESEQCTYHWGKAYTSRANGEKQRTYSCCSRSVVDSEGCSHGPHVFYESTAEELHSRHAFSFLRSPKSDSPKLDVVALDCEMIYTTGGMRVARVSIVDGSGKEIFDEFVRMDEGVNVIDYNTRFSGITPQNYATALRTLSSIREALDLLIDSNTILVGHALDNDLKTLRIIHHKCIDTALLFPHKAGAPYRRSLKDLVREKLGRSIQMGDANEGHSSLEDASATLDLVRWYILNKQKSAVHSGVITT
ncbi:RNA exonuclease 1-like protein [Psilocybe cubensis]|uniref:Exonuclease domain-containing protein n=2 Tax=Psilocybe cubensis TaxID=181762 RepID=A0A8H7XYU2_PSICU|nr:RNA exonuclease 1-like protein [Psilocybe cubensis]KAH9482740.1 RNA exonuclease 1-like protein [Psilocybe cubensis]